MLVAACLLLAACGSSGSRPDAGDPAARDRALDSALAQIGRPYRYGGADPAGFDCSGLVHYAYRRAGVSLPRSTRDQMGAGQRIALDELRPGDLLFYRFPKNQAKGWHVVMWLGGGRAIHAPSSDGEVEVIHVDAPWWTRRLYSAVAVAP